MSAVLRDVDLSRCSKLLTVLSSLRAQTAALSKVHEHREELAQLQLRIRRLGSVNCDLFLERVAAVEALIDKALVVAAAAGAVAVEARAELDAPAPPTLDGIRADAERQLHLEADAYSDGESESDFLLHSSRSGQSGVAIELVPIDARSNRTRREARAPPPAAHLQSACFSAILPILAAYFPHEATLLASTCREGRESAAAWMVLSKTPRGLWGRTALMDSARLNDCERVAWLLLCARADASASGLDGATALHIAASKNAVDSVEALLKHGVDVHACDAAQRTPLRCAGDAGALEALRVLVQARSLVNFPDTSGCTPLMGAATFDRAGAITLLAQKGADVDLSFDAFGRTALHLAASLGKLNAVRALLAARADVTATTTDGRTALRCAEDNLKALRHVDARVYGAETRGKKLTAVVAELRAARRG